MYTGNTSKPWAQSPKPDESFAGLKATRRNRIELGEWVSVYDADAQGIITEDGNRYVVICEHHASIVEVRTLADGIDCAREPDSFCDDCRAIVAAGYVEYHESKLREQAAEAAELAEYKARYGERANKESA